jgi:hypothetical protein
MIKMALWLAAMFVVPVALFGQSAAKQRPDSKPSLPVIDYNACPFEGCTFGKWIVRQDSPIFSTWKTPRTPVGRLRTGEVVTGMTGVHITYEPDRVQVLSAIPELDARPGDIILRYMYHGEGYADIWVNGRWHRNYDCTFIAEKTEGGCLRDCAAKVISNGRKDWWVQIQTPDSATGWAKADGQFDCMDALGGDDACDKLQQ